MVFTKTDGFRHRSIADGKAAISEIAAAKSVEVDFSEDANLFTDSGLAQYDAVVLLSSTGSFLNRAQQQAFVRFIRSGKGVAGIHAATDANYGWPWYQDLLGSSFNGHPKIQEATLFVDNKTNPATSHLNDLWTRTDEWYNFNPNPRQKQVEVLVRIDEDSYDAGKNAMGDDYPIAWCKHFQGGRSFYTAGGHTPASFKESAFIAHIWGGIEFAMSASPTQCNPNL